MVGRRRRDSATESTVVGGRVWPHADDAHACGEPGSDRVGGVLHHAGGGIHPEQPRGGEEDLGVGLSECDVLGGDGHRGRPHSCGAGPRRSEVTRLRRDERVSLAGELGHQGIGAAMTEMSVSGRTCPRRPAVVALTAPRSSGANRE